MSGRLIQSSRPGVSLIELVVSLIAATGLMIGMSLSLAIVFRSAETIEDMDRSEDGLVRDWVADDLRYATEIENVSATRWDFNRVGEDGNIQSIRYRVNNSGLQRREGTAPWTTIDPRVESFAIERHPFWIDAEENRIAEHASHAETVSSSAAPKVIGVTTAAANDDDELTINRPPSCMVGDWLFLATSVRNVNSVSLDGGGWSTQVDDNQNGFFTRVRLTVWSRKIESNTPNNFTVETPSNTTINAVVIGVRGCDPYNPVAGAMGQSAWILNTSTQQPKPGFRDSTEPDELNLQFLGADLLTVSTPSMNMPGYIDIAHSHTTTDTRRGLYVASRQGSLPATTATIQAECYWGTTHVIGSLRIRP